jgi:small subunit ribosomal protein S3
VWIFKGEILEHDPMAQDKRMSEAQEGGRPRRERDRDHGREREGAAA